MFILKILTFLKRPTPECDLSLVQVLKEAPLPPRPQVRFCLHGVPFHTTAQKEAYFNCVLARKSLTLWHFLSLMGGVGVLQVRCGGSGPVLRGRCPPVATLALAWAVDIGAVTCPF